MMDYGVVVCLSGELPTDLAGGIEKIGMYKKLFTLLIMVCSLVVASAYFSVGADDLSTVSVTTSDPRPSFRGVLGAGNTAGISSVIINVTNGAYPSTSSAQLYINDQIRIGEGGSMASYSVTDIVSASTFNISPVLAAGDSDTGDDVIATRSGSLTVKFKTKNAVNNGKFRVLVPALADNTSASDGLPDAGAFDQPAVGVGVTCPTDISNYTFGAGTAAVSSVTVGSTDYHAFVCPYTGTGSVNADFTATAAFFTINGLINPAPKTATHTLGTADTYTVLVQQLDGSSSVVDTTSVNIGVVEAVHVTATVDPQLSFRILGIDSGTSACGNTTGVTTTPTSVPFGSLAISAFTDAAQALAVSTNAQNGYVVTAKESDQLAKGGVTCTTDGSGVSTCIIDSNATNISHTNPATWSSTSFKGFGYSLHDVNTSGLTAAFSHDTNSGNCAGSSCYKQFADGQASEAAQTIFSSTTVADNHNLYVCYRAIVSSTQVAGDYENYITYTATATF